MHVNQHNVLMLRSVFL